MTDIEIQSKVSKGAAFLDHHCQCFWPDCINLQQLNLRSHMDCILGQLFGRFGDGAMQRLGLGTWSENQWQDAIDYGFWADSQTDVYPILTKFWVREIEQRRNNQKKEKEATVNVCTNENPHPSADRPQEP